MRFVSNTHQYWTYLIYLCMSFCLIKTETTKFVHIQNLLPSTLWGCLASHIPLLMKHAFFTPRTVGNEKWMKSFWNNVYDYHNASTIEGVCLSCIAPCNKGHALYKIHLYWCLTKDDYICLIFLPFNWYWSPVSSKSLYVRTAEVIPFSFLSPVLPFNLAALKN